MPIFNCIPIIFLGLFANAISFSGSALNPWALQSKPLELTQRLAENVGCTSAGTAEMVECLRGKTPAEIVTGQLKLSVCFLHIL